MRDTYRGGMSQVEFVQMDHTWRHRYEALNAWTWPSPYAVEELTGLPLPFEWEHSVALADRQDGDRLAAEAAFYPFPELAVPGGRLAANGLTSVAVQPTFRRQGLLRRMIGRYLDMSVARGDALSLLLAQEYGIYGRFGYGHASDVVTLRIPRGTQLSAPQGITDSADFSVDVDYVSADRDAPFIHRVQRAQSRPGTPVRELAGFQHRALTSPPAPAQPLRIVRVTRGDEPVAYALFSRPRDEGPSVAPVTDWNALGAAAEYTLWQALLNQDLIDIVEARRVPVDTALTSLLPDPRATAPSLHDDLWARILDLPTCLTARRYSADVDVVLKIKDPLIEANDGVWTLRVVDGKGEVSPTGAGITPDVSLSIAQLSAAYLGRPVLAPAGRLGPSEDLVEHTPGSIDRLHTALSWPELPGTTWGF